MFLVVTAPAGYLQVPHRHIINVAVLQMVDIQHPRPVAVVADLAVMNAGCSAKLLPVFGLQIDCSVPLTHRKGRMLGSL
jgi:hypothetical protein